MRKAWKFASVERRFYSLALSLDLPLLLLKGSRGFTLFFLKNALNVGPMNDEQLDCRRAVTKNIWRIYTGHQGISFLFWGQATAFILFIYYLS